MAEQQREAAAGLHLLLQQQGVNDGSVYSDEDFSGGQGQAINLDYLTSLQQQDSGVVAEGQQLYLDFLRRQMREQNLEEPEDFRQEFSSVEPVNQDLGLLLDHFSQSDERERVREKAEEVHLEGITYEGFSGLLSSLFQEGGITYERILVLFCFCSDVCLRALRETASRYFHLMTNFSLRFITGTLCVWVQSRGGWGAVVRGLQQSCGTYGMAAIGCLAVVAVGTALWKN